MKASRFILALTLLLLLAGCESGTISNPLPEIRDVTGPTGELNDHDYKASTAVVDVKGFSNTEIYFRYIENDGSRLRSAASIEIQPACAATGSVSNCSITFPTALDTPDQETVFEVGTEVFYQWFVDYRLPNGSDVATIEGPVRSFHIVPSEVCTEDYECLGARICGPGGQVFRRVCFTPRGTPCQVGANGRLCSGHGQCDWDTGQCVCDAEYTTAPDCGIVCQRCYGAIGNNCGAAEGAFGLCNFDESYSLPSGLTMEEACASNDPPPMVTCSISVGSWTHDECCIREGEFENCTVGVGNVCQEEGNLAALEYTISRVWTRTVDPCVAVCGVHGPAAPTVDFNTMCSGPGNQISCNSVEEAAAFCCSGSASSTIIPGVCRCD